jgi:hypothetical protein
VRDGLADLADGAHLELEIALQYFAHVFADHQLVQVLEIGQPFEEQDPLDELVRMLHLVDRFFVFVVAHLFQAPIPQHSGVQKILIDCGELVFQHRIQMLDDVLIAFHRCPFNGR